MVTDSIKKTYMQRCLDLAILADSTVTPNPMVGAVIVYNNKIIGEGFHRKYGEAHAEVEAINSVEDKSLLKESTLYVSLEPCCHFGKTPPCTQKILDAEIPHVVIGALDPSPKVNGSGINILKQAGVIVETGVLEEEAKYLNRYFYTFYEKKRPFIFFKWAQSIDGFIDRLRSVDEKPTQITGESIKVLVHRKRAQSQGIMVGTNTVIMDDPLLTTRSWIGKSPIRITFDKSGKINPKSKIFNKESSNIIFVPFDTKKNYPNAENIKINFDDNFECNLIDSLYNRGIQSLMIEGGSYLIQSFVSKNLWDEAYVYINSRMTLATGIKAPVINKMATTHEFLENGYISILKYLNDSSR